MNTHAVNNISFKGNLIVLPRNSNNLIGNSIGTIPSLKAIVDNSASDIYVRIKRSSYDSEMYKIIFLNHAPAKTVMEGIRNLFSFRSKKVALTRHYHSVDTNMDLLENYVYLLKTLHKLTSSKGL